VTACRVEGCEREYNSNSGARGLCAGHYGRLKRYGDVRADVPISDRVRGTCLEYGCNAPAKAKGLCDKHYQAAHRAHTYQKYSTWSRERERAKREELLGRPRPDRCEVCDEVSGRGSGVVFDHCHETGKPRGWLCGRCNIGLGMLRDSPSLLRKLAEYLETHQGVKR
jgi:hypothetical protein